MTLFQVRGRHSRTTRNNYSGLTGQPTVKLVKVGVRSKPRLITKSSHVSYFAPENVSVDNQQRLFHSSKYSTFGRAYCKSEG
jgi:hypothetical protein